MTTHTKLVPSASQTVGPYFRIGLEHLIDRAKDVFVKSANTVEIRGRVLDGLGFPVPDAMLEFWYPHPGVSGSPVTGPTSFPAGFQRIATDDAGQFSLLTAKPGPVPTGTVGLHAPHLVVLVFARGLLRNLITRVYFPDEPANATDPVLCQVPDERRRTLIASADCNDASLLRWNVILKGKDETVFFAW